MGMTFIAEAGGEHMGHFSCFSGIGNALCAYIYRVSEDVPWLSGDYYFKEEIMWQHSYDLIVLGRIRIRTLWVLRFELEKLPDKPYSFWVDVHQNPGHYVYGWSQWSPLNNESTQGGVLFTEDYMNAITNAASMLIDVIDKQIAANISYLESLPPKERLLYFLKNKYRWLFNNEQLRRGLHVDHMAHIMGVNLQETAWLNRLGDLGRNI